jgi:hypothetical protein
LALGEAPGNGRWTLLPFVLLLLLHGLLLTLEGS